MLLFSVITVTVEPTSPIEEKMRQVFIDGISDLRFLVQMKHVFRAVLNKTKYKNLSSYFIGTFTKFLQAYFLAKSYLNSLPLKSLFQI